MANLSGLLAGLAGLPQGYIQGQDASTQLALRNLALQQARQQQLGRQLAGSALLGKQPLFGSGFMSAPPPMPGQSSAPMQPPALAGPGPALMRPQSPPSPPAYVAAQPSQQVAAEPSPPTAPPAGGAAPAGGAMTATGAAAPLPNTPDPNADPMDQQMATFMQRIMQQQNPQQLAQAIQAARPDANPEAVLAATEELMKMGASGDKMQQAYALLAFKELQENARHLTPSGSSLVGADTADKNRAAADARAAANRRAAAERSQAVQASIDKRAAARAGAVGGKNTQNAIRVLSIQLQEIRSELNSLNNPVLPTMVDPDTGKTVPNPDYQALKKEEAEVMGQLKQLGYGTGITAQPGPPAAPQAAPTNPSSLLPRDMYGDTDAPAPLGPR